MTYIQMTQKDIISV